MKIIVSNNDSLKAVAKCHSAAFPESLATSLGQRYVSRMLSWYLSSDKTFLFHIEEEQGNVAGYCGGMISDGSLGTGSASGMAQHSFNHAIKSFILRPWLIFHPEVRVKWSVLFKNIKMKLGLTKRIHFSDEQKQKMSKDPHAGLVVIGVDPKYQGKGYGSLLLKEFEKKAVDEYGIKKLQLTVKADNYQAIKSYERNGWQKGNVNNGSLSMYKHVE